MRTRNCTKASGPLAVTGSLVKYQKKKKKALLFSLFSFSTHTLSVKTIRALSKTNAPRRIIKPNVAGGTSHIDATVLYSGNVSSSSCSHIFIDWDGTDLGSTLKSDVSQGEHLDIQGKRGPNKQNINDTTFSRR